MMLTKEEERALSGEYGEALSQAMRILVKVGEVLGAERLVPISHAHASGVSYATIGEPGVHWLESLVKGGAKVSVYSTVNPIGFDPYSDIIKVDENFVKGQIRILEAFEKMGFDTSLTCTPYYLREPKPFERLAWGESSAVIYANTVLGAFTNREGGPVAVAAAIAGKIYEAGLQVLENRRTDSRIRLGFRPTDAAEWSAVGYAIGERIGQGIPRLEVPPPPRDHLKYMLAASAASGGLAMMVIEGVTPPKTYLLGEEEKVEIGREDVEHMFGSVEDADLVFHGCPHASLKELVELDNLIKEKVEKEVWVAVAPRLYERANDVIKSLSKKGVKFVRGTCLVVSPIDKMGIRKVATTSAKTYFYLKRRGLDVWLVRLRDVASA
ncbi:aconitase X catalytic domain-containing protein [Ignicoccus hospitalis]|uniref:Phosphomevalonate dehydratase large subunit n=1 Tax=Ignicoccus hospitalis (strain KIN4/I / DSM 18386 / JCM 14125) TaxID=453591 RepID=A8AAC5_IGNH4|nr:aconitase X catalytic domain-containing protein [Ignicoccus hospitalis]ABU81877.1 aconitase subunit 1 [Ignicoccus hospitalis KIN4/I]HIH89965.1 DUF521 domain-containing protein [Desulfurococcaceae archaeon]